MTNQLPLDDGTQSRTKRQQHVIETADRALTSFSEQGTELRDNGDIHTVESNHIVIVNGEAITDASQVADEWHEEELVARVEGAAGIGGPNTQWRMEYQERMAGERKTSRTQNAFRITF